jgi:hypothetical protein
MAMSTTLIKNALALNAANPNFTQDEAATNIANAIISTIESATLTYSSGLTDGTTGALIVGTLSTVVIS